MRLYHQWPLGSWQAPPPRQQRLQPQVWKFHYCILEVLTRKTLRQWWEIRWVGDEKKFKPPWSTAPSQWKCWVLLVPHLRLKNAKNVTNQRKQDQKWKLAHPMGRHGSLVNAKLLIEHLLNQKSGKWQTLWHWRRILMKLKLGFWYDDIHASKVTYFLGARVSSWSCQTKAGVNAVDGSSIAGWHWFPGDDRVVDGGGGDDDDSGRLFW